MHPVIVVALTACAALGLLGLLRAIMAAHETTRRLREITATARRIAEGDPEAVADLPGADDVAGLAQAVNAMVNELRTRIRAAEAERDALAAVLTHMAEGVIIVDEEGIVRLLNPSAERLLDIPPGRAVGKSLMAVVRSHVVAGTVRDALAQGARDLEPQIIEIGPPARRRTVQIVASPVPGDAPQVLLALHDVTELERATIVRRDFVANVSHELRTPVAALKALVDTLTGGALEDAEAGREFLSHMQRETDHLAELVEDLLDLSRVEAGQMDMRPVPMDLAALVTSAAERLRPLAQRQGVMLEVQSMGTTTALADPVRTDQVVTNLIHNAVKFTPPGGQVRVTTQPHPEGVAVLVQDTGAGIPEQAMSRLFERFYKADRARAGGGTGLGLAIAKHFVQAEGGRIWAESAGAGLGSTFGFVLPTPDEQDAEAEAAHTKDSALPNAGFKGS